MTLSCVSFTIYQQCHTDVEGNVDIRISTGFVVSHVIIVAFHPILKMDRVIIQRGFEHSIEKLTTIDYLANDQMFFVDVNLIKQFKYHSGRYEKDGGRYENGGH